MSNDRIVVIKGEKRQIQSVLIWRSTPLAGPYRRVAAVVAMAPVDLDTSRILAGWLNSPRTLNLSTARTTKWYRWPSLNWNQNSYKLNIYFPLNYYKKRKKKQIAKWSLMSPEESQSFDCLKHEIITPTFYSSFQYFFVYTMFIPKQNTVRLYYWVL